MRKPGSHSRNLRRVRQGLDLIKALFEQFLSSKYVYLLLSSYISYFYLYIYHFANLLAIEGWKCWVSTTTLDAKISVVVSIHPFSFNIEMSGNQTSWTCEIAIYVGSMLSSFLLFFGRFIMLYVSCILEALFLDLSLHIMEFWYFSNPKGNQKMVSYWDVFLVHPCNVLQTLMLLSWKFCLINHLIRHQALTFPSSSYIVHLSSTHQYCIRYTSIVL